MLAKTKIKLEDFQDPRWPMYSVDAYFDVYIHGTTQDWKLELSLTECSIGVWNSEKEWHDPTLLELHNLPPGFQTSIQGKALEKASDKFSRGEVIYAD